MAGTRSRCGIRCACVYGVDAGDVYWAASDVGWVVGHSYIVYAPLLRGCTSVMYEGKPVGTPDAGAFWRVCAQHGVKVLFTAPTAMRAIKQQDPDGKLRAQLRSVEARGAVPRRRALRSADRSVGGGTARQAGGRPLVADRNRLGDHRRFSGNTACFRSRPAPAAGRARLRPAGAGRGGPSGRPGTDRQSLRPPPPAAGCAPTLWQHDEGYHAAYLADFPGWYRTGDAGTIDAEATYG